MTPAFLSWPLPGELPDDPRAALRVWQDGRCAMCGQRPHNPGPSPSLLEDHDHDSGAVRGLLCHRDNARESLAVDQTTWDLYRSAPPTARIGRPYTYLSHTRIGTRAVQWVRFPTADHDALAAYAAGAGITVQDAVAHAVAAFVEDIATTTRKEAA